VRFFLFLYTITLVVLSLYPFDEMPSYTLIGIDKVSHIIMYLILSLLLGLSYQHWSRLKVTLISITFGIAMEVCQETLTQTRMFDIFDILANIIGSLIGIWLFVLVMKKASESD